MLKDVSELLTEHVWIQRLLGRSYGRYKLSIDLLNCLSNQKEFHS